MYRFHRRLASFSRVIRFDVRGIGLSSRVPSLDVIGPEFWAQDAIAVLDAVGCEQATVFAPSYTATTGIVLAADYPERVRNLVIVNGAARAMWAPDYPFGARMDTSEPFSTVAMEPDAVEQGFDVLRASPPASPATRRSAHGGTGRATGRHRRAWPAPSPRSSRQRMSVTGSRASPRRR